MARSKTDGANQKELYSRIITLTDPQSHAAEVYRMLRTNLLARLSEYACPIIVVTSSTEGEGKTTTAANLAVVSAQQAKRKVLLIDANLRRPRINRLFRVMRNIGLSEVLQGQYHVHDATVPSIESDKLYILPAGEIPTNPAELLGNQAMKELLDWVRGQFAMVIIDAPPVLPVADAQVLATQCDGVILVAQHRRVKREQVQEAGQMLALVRAPIVGTILNRKKA